MDPVEHQTAGDAWREQLRRDGYVLFRGIAGDDRVRAARAAIDHDLATNFDPARQVEYDNRSFCPDIRDAPPIMSLLQDTPIRMVLDAAIGWTRLGHGTGQIALRRARNAAAPCAPEPHIDGIPTPYNGLPQDVLVSNFTVLVGVYLSPVTRPFAGNFTVWPGSHHLLEQHFREHGPAALRDGMPRIALGDPVQLMVETGDAVLCHYQLAHGAAVNLSDHDRYAVYFRLWLTDIESRRWHLMTHIWDGWSFPDSAY